MLVRVGRGVIARRLGRPSLAFVLAACTSCTEARPPAAESHWVAAWAAAPQLVEPRNLPPDPGLSGSTLRQILRVSLGGRQVRVRFSNTFGDSAISITSAHIAPSLGASVIDPTGDRSLTFRGQPSTVIPPGKTGTSDPLEYAVTPLSDLAVTMHISEAPTDITGHPGSRTTSYLQAGDAVTAGALPEAVTTDHWYVLAGVDVLATDSAAATVVVLGNSIADGRGSGTNQNNRWPDNLARRLQEDLRTKHVAVVNAGIGGNAVVTGGLGPPALARVERDVFEQSAVRWLIISEGVNDIGVARGPEIAAVADGLIEAYTTIITEARASGLRVYGATILPFGGSFYDNPEREAARQRVNRWIRTSGAFDAVIDFDAALRDPANPRRLLPEADSGDHLHPGVEGYRLMAESIDLRLFLQ